MTHPRCLVLFMTMLLMPWSAIARELPASLDSSPVPADKSESGDTAPADRPILTAWVMTPVPDEPVDRKRPRLLVGMYAGSGLLHGYDIYSTLAGIKANKVELNPLMREIVKNPPVFIAVQSVMTLATIAVADQLWRQHHPGQAIAVMILSNGVMAAIAARNASVLRTR